MPTMKMCFKFNLWTNDKIIEATNDADENGGKSQNDQISQTSLGLVRPRPVTMNDFEMALKDQKDFKQISDLSYYI